MNREDCKQLFLRIEQWMNTPTSPATQPSRLRWWVTPNAFDKYLFRVAMLLTVLSAIYLFGCNSAASSGREYIGTWEHVTTSQNTRIGTTETAIAKRSDILSIIQDGDHFLVKQTKTLDDGFGKTSNQGTHTYPATLKDGILQLADGSAQPYTYVKATDSLLTHGSEHDIEYHRSKP